MVSVGSDIVPIVAMVLVQTGYAGMSIISKLAMNDGMKPFVLVTYRQIIAAVATFPFAFFFERKTIPRITLPILFQIFLCSITGTFLNQMLFFTGLRYSTPTVASAMANILPAVTFIFAAIFRQETVRLKNRAGQAKLVGTAMCVGGAMLLSFYHGHVLNIGESAIHWKYVENHYQPPSSSSSNNNTKFVGPICLILSTASLGLWFVIQSRLSKQFAAPYTTTTVMCLMAGVVSGVFGACFVRNRSDWSIFKSSIKIISIIYTAVVCSALSLSVMSWCIHLKGPLYTAVFNPLSLIITAIFSWALLHDKLYVGTVIGGIIIILGLYTVLWGKDKEMKEKQKQAAAAAASAPPVFNDMVDIVELQPPPSHHN